MPIFFVVRADLCFGSQGENLIYFSFILTEKHYRNAIKESRVNCFGKNQWFPTFLFDNDLSMKEMSKTLTTIHIFAKNYSPQNNSL